VTGDYANQAQLASIAANVAQIIAIVLGGTWAYLKFVRGRTFSNRAELHIEGNVHVFDDEPAIQVEVIFRNTGLSIIRLHPGLAALHIDTLATDRWMAGNAVWRPAEAELPTSDESGSTLLTPLFEEERNIEPGSQVRDSQIIIVPAPPDGLPLAFRLRAEVMTRMRFRRKPFAQWTDNVVCTMPPLLLASSDTS
jgi:hypothetical protein